LTHKELTINVFDLCSNTALQYGAPNIDTW